MPDHHGVPIEVVPAIEDWPADFVVLYRTRWEPMVRLARLLTAGDPASEELVQDAFIKVHEKWGAIENPPAYLRAAVVNTCRNHHRVRRHQPPPVVVAASVEHEDDALRAAIASLPERQRSVLVLRYYEDLPEAEIARVLECSVSAVKSRLHRAMQALRKVIEP